MLDNSTDGEQYRKIIREWFNGAVLENELKWPNWEGDRTKALAAVDWLQASGISKLRGHNLIWPNWNLMPPDVQKLSADARSMRNRVNDHIADEVAANRGRLTDWDVLNEPYSNRDVQGVLGNGEMAEWFKQERRLDPDAALYVNDYGILEGNGADIVRQNGYFNIIQNILENGGPIDGIGLQGHFNYQFTGPVRMLEILDRFAKLGPSIKVTEFDVDVADETLQAEFTRDFLTAMFSHPAVNGIFVWGFWEARQAPERRYVPARLVKETQC